MLNKSGIILFFSTFYRFLQLLQLEFLDFQVSKQINKNYMLTKQENKKSTKKQQKGAEARVISYRMILHYILRSLENCWEFTVFIKH